MVIESASTLAHTEAEGRVTCRHYWIIEPPMGRVSMGVCRLCNGLREFMNYVEERPWGDDDDIPLAEDWDG